ncbi:unnamed protein product [Rotaria sp. Silwood2]|nr:unnamed protein product [Rotaria sp. Silwood2]CAF4540936.1 unnamed protein product [Rotaria sp. Silwood2]
MIPALRSIDKLLNQFDELSKYHKNFLSNFDKNFSDIENPLRDIARSEEEQQRTTSKILLVLNENDNQIESIKTIEDFHRTIIKNRYLHRPPIYSSNDNSLCNYIPSRTSSIITESTSFSQTLPTNIKTITPQLIVPTSNKIINETKVHLQTKIKSKIVQLNSSSPQQYTHNKVTTFSMETVNRLSKPKTYHQLTDEKSTIKHVERRSKSYENIKQEKFECSTSISVSLPPIKRIKTTNIKPTSKRLAAENNILIQIQKRALINNSSHPLAFVNPVSTINLSLPNNLQQQKSPRFAILPRIVTTNKRSMIHLKA